MYDQRIITEHRTDLGDLLSSMIQPPPSRVATKRDTLNDSVLSAVEPIGLATPEDVASVLGVDWRDDLARSRVRTALGTLAHRGVLRNVARGVYEVTIQQTGG